MRPRDVLVLVPALAACSASSPSSSDADAGWAGAPPTETADVTLAPETVVVEDDAIDTGLRTIGDDGATFTFAPDARGLDKLTPGTVAILGKLAIVKIDKVEPRPEGVVVTTKPAGLGDAIQEGHIAWSRTVDFTKGGSGRFAAFRPTIGPASFALDLSSDTKTFHADLEGYAIDATFTPSQSALDIELDVTKHLDCIDVHVHAKGHVQRFRSEVSIDIKDHKVVHATNDNQHLEGTLDLTWDASKPDPEDCSEKKVLELPFGGKLPFFVGAVPMWVGVTSNVAIVVGLTGKGAVAHGTAHLAFGGRQKFEAKGAGSFDATFEPERTDVDLGDDTQTTSAGVSGFSAALSMPRLELGVGLDKIAGSMVHFSFITSAVSLTPGELGLKHCQKHTITVSGKAGARAELFGYDADLWEKEVFSKDFDRTIPDGVDCDP